MRFFVVLFIVFSFNFTNAFANSLNGTFQVDNQSEGYLLGWNLSWAENCNQYGYYNKFWKLYKKILATNNPKFEDVKQGWSQASQADESTNCSENVLKQILTNTENLLNNSDNEKSLNTGSENAHSSKEEMISILKKCPKQFEKSSEHWLGMPNFKLYMCSSNSLKNLNKNDVSQIVHYFKKWGNRNSTDYCPNEYSSIKNGNLCVDKQCYSACTNANLYVIEKYGDSLLRMSFHDKKCPNDMVNIYTVFKKTKKNPTYSFCQQN